MDSEKVLTLARLYAKRVKLSLSTVSTYMSGSGDVLQRLENGHDLTTRRAAGFVLWLSTHWPPDLEWPSDIPRPSVPTKPKRKSA